MHNGIHMEKKTVEFETDRELTVAISVHQPPESRTLENALKLDD